MPSWWLRVEARLHGQSRESEISQVAKDRVGLIDDFPAGGVGLDVASRNKQVLPAIVVKIVKLGAVTTHASGEAVHWPRRIRVEKTLPRIPVERKGLVGQGDEHDIGIAVVIDVPEL